MSNVGSASVGANPISYNSRTGQYSGQIPGNTPIGAQANGIYDPSNPGYSLNAGGIGAELGIDSQFVAQQAPTVGAQYNVNQGYLAGMADQGQGQSQAALGRLNGDDRWAQQSYLASLGQMGSNTSAAQGVLQQGLNASNQGAMSLARSQGGNPAQQAAALRGAQMQMAQNSGNAGAQAAQLQGQQQQAAAQMQGQALAGMSGQDLSQAQLGGQLQQAGMNNVVQAGGYDLQGQISNNQINSSNYNAAQGLNQSTEAANSAANSALIDKTAGAIGSAIGGMSDARSKMNLVSLSGGDSDPYAARQSMGSVGMPAKSGSDDGGSSLGKMMGGMGGDSSNGGASTGGADLSMSESAMSDERAKGARAPATNDADRFLATLKPYTYEYKHAEDEPTNRPSGGRYLGVIAQNVERGPTGDTLVEETPRGKALETRANLGAALAGIGRLHERVRMLEQQGGR